LEPYWLKGYRDVTTITLSQSSKESLHEYGLQRVTVIPVGYDHLLNRPDVPKEDHPTVVFVGRLETHKRPEDALRAFSVLQRSIPDAVLWIIGTGPLEDSLRLSGIESVQFLGKISFTEKMHRLARAHVLISTSVREGWGLVVTEAAMVGTPTIAYDVPGLKDSVAASNGILSKTNPKDLGKQLTEFFINQNGGEAIMASPGGVAPWHDVALFVLHEALFVLNGESFGDQPHDSDEHSLSAQLKQSETIWQAAPIVSIKPFSA